MSEGSSSGFKGFARSLAADVGEGELLTYASAMAFRALFASIPLALFALALLGFLNLTPVWTAGVGPLARASLPPPAFALLDTTVLQVLATRQAFWLTIGLALAIWQLSSTVRVTGDALDRIYGLRDERSTRRWLATSILVAIAVAVLLLAAAITIHFGSHVVEALFGPGTLADVVGFVLRWPLALAAMLAAVGLLLRYAPGEQVRWRWAGTGAVATVAAWAGASLAFGAYATWVIDYGSLFGGLAFPFVLLFYLNFSALAFLVGVWLERRRRLGADRPLRHPAADTEDDA